MIKKLFTIISAFICVYTYSQSEQQTILNIDINKNIESYNYSITELDFLLGNYLIDLYKLQPKNTHFLKKFNLDRERVIFSKDGVFESILLYKEYSSKSILEQEFTEIRYAINQKYGNPAQQFKETVLWHLDFMDIVLYITEKTTHIVFEKSKRNFEQVESGASTEKTRVETLTKMAEKGDAEAQYNLFGLYFVGKDVQKDLKKAIYWCKKSAEQGYANAQYALGACYSDGDGVLVDKNKAFYWLEKSAKQDINGAQYLLALLCYEGKGTLVNKKQAFYWCGKSAQQGNPNAQFFLGQLYFFGEGTLENKKQSAFWMKKAYENKESGHRNPQQKAQDFWKEYELWKYE